MKQNLVLILVFVWTSCNELKRDHRTTEDDVRMGVEVSYMTWEVTLDEPTKLKDVEITIENLSETDLSRVRYRLHLFIYENEQEKKIFSKAYHYDDLNSGDIVRVPVPDLYDFNLRVPASRQGFWYWDATIEKTEDM